eukprot:TRINITY_DN1031_c3_g1_i1.p1 TRINITY_DN1031_c3_g1~~TRINITY_DN1031_c3_g1_i1.p1  ORF type:complete len:248 (-),score=68.66 TRINITY_DN1031_c3_g1_i1:68-811(-)
MKSIKIVEGNIGAGKTTLTKKLGEKYGSKIFFEPTAKNPFLENFYKEPKKYAFRMQLWLLKHRYKAYNEALITMKKNDVGIVMDRSIFSDYTFAKLNMMEGNISKEEFKIYLELRDKMLKNVVYPDHVIYLKVSVDECHRRIHDIRKRKEEISTGIPKPYLAGLEECYEDLLQQLCLKNVNITSVDWNNFGDVEPISEKINEAKHSRDNVKKISDWDFDQKTFSEIQNFCAYPEWKNDYLGLYKIDV